MANTAVVDLRSAKDIGVPPSAELSVRQPEGVSLDVLRAAGGKDGILDLLNIDPSKRTLLQNAILCGHPSITEAREAGFISDVDENGIRKAEQSLQRLGTLIDNLSRQLENAGATNVVKKLTNETYHGELIVTLLALSDSGLSPEKAMQYCLQAPQKNLAELMNLGSIAVREQAGEVFSEDGLGLKNGIDRINSAKVPVEKRMAGSATNAPHTPPKTRLLDQDLIDAVRTAAEHESTSIAETSTRNRGVKALLSLLGDPSFRAKFSNNDLITFLKSDTRSINYLAGLDALHHSGCKGCVSTFGAALRTAREALGSGKHRESGALMGHFREVSTAMALQQDGYTIEELSAHVSDPAAAKPAGKVTRDLNFPISRPEIDIVASKGGKRFFVEVKNSEDAFFKGKSGPHEASQLSDQMYLAQAHGRELLVVICEGTHSTRPAEVAAYVADAVEKLTRPQVVRYSSMAGQTPSSPIFKYTNQFLRRD